MNRRETVSHQAPFILCLHYPNVYIINVRKMMKNMKVWLFLNFIANSLDFTQKFLTEINFASPNYSRKLSVEFWSRTISWALANILFISFKNTICIFKFDLFFPYLFCSFKFRPVFPTISTCYWYSFTLCSK